MSKSPTPTYKEVATALGFIIFVLILIAMISAGVIAYPVTLGLTLIITVMLILIGHMLVVKGKLHTSTLPYYYVLVIGMIMVFYGLAYKGYIPVFATGATITEIALSTAVIYTLIVVGVAIALYFLVFRKQG